VHARLGLGTEHGCQLAMQTAERPGQNVLSANSAHVDAAAAAAAAMVMNISTSVPSAHHSASRALSADPGSLLIIATDKPTDSITA